MEKTDSNLMFLNQPERESGSGFAHPTWSIFSWWKTLSDKEAMLEADAKFRAHGEILEVFYSDPDNRYPLDMLQACVASL